MKPQYQLQLEYPRINVASDQVSAIVQVQQEPMSESIIIPLSPEGIYQGAGSDLVKARLATTVTELFESQSIVMHPSRFAAWRMTERNIADIKGQPYLGTCVIYATDGVHAFVETPAKPFLFRIHITNWLGKVEPVGGSRSLGYNPKKKRVSKEERLLKQADELMTELGL